MEYLWGRVLLEGEKCIRQDNVVGSEVRAQITERSLRFQKAFSREKDGSI